MLVKMSDDVALAVSSLQKSFVDYDLVGSGYGEVHEAGAFCVSPANATQMFRKSLDAIVAKGEDVAEQITKSTAAYKDYIEKVSAVLPADLLKADAVLKDYMATGGAGDDQETGDGLGDQANGGKKTTMKSSDGQTLSDEGDPGAEDPLIKGKAKKADAGKNGTGTGAELGGGTETDPRATADDDENNEVDAKPGDRVSGSNSGLPTKAKAPTKKDDEIEDDDSTNGAQSDLPAKAKAPTKKGNEAGPDPKGESHAGEGAAEETDQGSNAANARGTADDAAHAGGKVTGKPKGKTLDMSGVPDKAKAPTAKNDGDAIDPKKTKAQEVEDSMSGSGAQEKDVQTYKADDPIMQALSALSKQVKESIDVVTKSVSDLTTRVDQVAEQARKTDAALNGTVFNEAESETQRLFKSDGTQTAPALLDTAYNRRSAA
jgi:hypothetical protein